MHIGDTNLGMKYLLINSKYSSGADMKLPMYSSTSFRRHLEPYFKEEIIGDVHLSFNFKIGNPQKQALPRNEPPLVSKPIVSKDSPPKITLESKTIPGVYLLSNAYALSFYRSQNILCPSKLFGPDQTLNCIYCCTKGFCASTKTKFTNGNHLLVWHKKFGPVQNLLGPVCIR